MNKLNKLSISEAIYHGRPHAGNVGSGNVGAGTSAPAPEPPPSNVGIGTDTPPPLTEGSVGIGVSH